MRRSFQFIFALLAVIFILYMLDLPRKDPGAAYSTAPPRKNIQFRLEDETGIYKDEDVVYN